MNISSGEKEALRKELELLTHEQRSLQTKIDELERELEGERAKKRLSEREINEINIQISQKKLQSGSESSRVQWLRDEILKKNA